MRKVSGKAYSLPHRAIGIVLVLLSLVSLWTIAPLISARFSESRTNAHGFVVMAMFFALLAVLGLHRVLASVSLDSSGLVYRGLFKDVRVDWQVLRTARTTSLKGVFYFVVRGPRAEERWISCSDHSVRRVVATDTVECEIKNRLTSHHSQRR